MLNKIDVSKILFLDIETVPLSYKYSELEEKMQLLWDKETKCLQERDNSFRENNKVLRKGCGCDDAAL